MTGEPDEDDDNAEEGASMRERLQKTPTKERFYELAPDKVNTEAMVKNLVIERDEAITHRDIAIRERGDLTFRLMNLQNQTGTDEPIAGAAATRKSTKMPDAPMLNDGKEVRFETWETVIRQKLKANADHYPLPVHRKLYVQSRYEGKAQLHITPRLNAESMNPYRDSEDMIAHLKTVFANPNLNQDTVLFDTFTQSYQSMSHEINLQQEAKSTSRTRPTILATGGSGALTTNQSNTPRVKREYTPSLLMSERETLMKEGRYFNYKEQGHMTRDCPKKKLNPPTIAATAPRVNEVAELESHVNDNQGKASA
ncbi:hypothetical protein N7447_002231 [Penicillium robsamsonii]|uniref:uncharacterized protein n=1 Tax=Penicillium robsamsonii TaxID=1792511 RepID=UPI0025479757|nr:uncharacterized protein N7447_002231 [Penicillium robsamsonii]KAJ5836205.1 hypothetical protein N7447_002231 [Penicillium robsamsonii]